MSKITLLDSKIAELIAAGEVVERPSSVVKELVENSVDAGATHITVEVRGGGIEYIRVTDDGEGMSKEDLSLAFLRHATSKIHTADDLYNIYSLGFRGEALASISAVSKVEVFSKRAKDNEGTRVLLEGGSLLETDKAGCALGTTFVMRDLFYNTPARMKFLKKSSSEAAATASLLDRLALCWPHISLRYISDGKEQLFTPGDSTLMGAIYAVYGRDIAGSLLEVEYTLDNVTVKGYISKPLAARKSRKSQHFYLNNRLINAPILTAALEEGCKSSIMTGHFPFCALHITIHPSLTDVNVHPSKAQVKFADDNTMFSAVYWAVRNALTADDGKAKPFTEPAEKNADIDHTENTGLQLPLMKEETNKDGTDRVTLPGGISYTPQNEDVHFLSSPSYTDSANHSSINLDNGENQRDFPHQSKEFVYDKDTPLDKDGFSEKDSQTPQPAVNAYPVKLLGEVFETYYIAESGDEILLVDKHAAHERLLFEQLKKTRHSDAQVLLSPITVRLDKTELSALLDNSESLLAYGFLIEEFGPGVVMIREIPAFLSGADIPSAITDIASSLSSAKKGINPEIEDEMLHRMACRAAVKSGMPGNIAEQKALVDELLANPDLKYCPHGRPIVVALSRQWMDKQFRRIK